MSDLQAGNVAGGGSNSVLMLEGSVVPALSMDTSSGENYLALSVPPHGEMVVVSAPDSEYFLVSLLLCHIYTCRLNYPY